MNEAIKILLVDDVPQNIVALDALLRRPGVEALHAKSGAEALELLLRHDIALALVDVQMPEMDGFELAELMRGSPRTRHVPIIFLTATDRDAIRTFRGYDAGAVDFLYKPFDPHILRSKVEVFVQLQTQKLQLAEQLETVRQVVRTNEMFVAVLGHDLRNPLSSIMASAEVLRRVDDPVRIATATERIRRSGSRMAKMIDQLLDVARMRSGQLTVSPAPMNLRALCETIVGEFDALDEPTPIDIECIGDTSGVWDAERLGQVLSNLIGNALHHGDTSQPVRVRIDGSSRHELRVIVANAGEIPESARQHIFEPFRSGKNVPTGQPSRGLGLGLFIAHELVGLHGGTIEARAAPVSTGTTSLSDSVAPGDTHQGTHPATVPGTVFEITLPKRTDANAPAQRGTRANGLSAAR